MPSEKSLKIMHVLDRYSLLECIRTGKRFIECKHKILKEMHDFVFPSHSPPESTLSQYYHIFMNDYEEYLKRTKLTK